MCVLLAVWSLLKCKVPPREKGAASWQRDKQSPNLGFICVLLQIVYVFVLDFGSLMRLAVQSRAPCA